MNRQVSDYVNVLSINLDDTVNAENFVPTLVAYHNADKSKTTLKLYVENITPGTITAPEYIEYYAKLLV